MITIDRIDSAEQLRCHTDTWNRMAGEHVFQRSEWLWPWWQAYAAGRELYVLLARGQQEDVAGFVPCYRQRGASGTRTIRFLGSGKASTDYQTILTRPDHKAVVAEAVADWLLAAHQSTEHGWDQLDFEAVAANDAVMSAFTQRMKDGGAPIDVRETMPTWKVELPPSWDEYLAERRANVRQRIRRLFRRHIETGVAEFHVLPANEELQPLFDEFVRLHQQRWQAVGVDGCFSRPEFGNFLKNACRQMQAGGQLWLSSLSIEKQLAGVSLFLVQGQTAWMYQCGISHEFRTYQPGWMLNALNLRAFIARDIRTCDYLRGDERYKRELGGLAVPQQRIRVHAPRAYGVVLHGMTLAHETLRAWGRQLSDRG